MIEDIELLKASTIEIREFINQCNVSSGKLHILVHPFYSEDISPKKNKRFVTREYLKNRDQYIKSLLESKTPLIIFQQASNYNKMISKISQSGNSRIYNVKTKDGEETPKGGRKDWDLLAKIFLNAKIEIITVDGLFLVSKSISKAIKEFDIRYDEEKIQLEFIQNIPTYLEKYPIAKKWLKKNFVPTGCVGYTIMNLLKYGFDVSIGELTAPD